MASLPCQSDDGNQAVFVGTMLETGNAVALCDDCMVGWAVSVLAVMTGTRPEDIVTVISLEGDVAVDEAHDVVADSSPAADDPEDPPPPTDDGGHTPQGSADQPTATDAAATPAASEPSDHSPTA